MGSGKTTIGNHLSEVLNYKFIDLDQAIENEEQQTISELFSKMWCMVFEMVLLIFHRVWIVF